MANLITEDTLLQCNMGTAFSELIVTSQKFFSIEGKLIATEKDNQSVLNIKPFGQCRLKPTSGGFRPCVPSPEQWKNTAPKDKVNDALILSDISVCPCLVGGVITVKEKGYTGKSVLD